MIVWRQCWEITIDVNSEISRGAARSIAGLVNGWPMAYRSMFPKQTSPTGPYAAVPLPPSEVLPAQHRPIDPWLHPSPVAGRGRQEPIRHTAAPLIGVEGDRGYGMGQCLHRHRLDIDI